MKLNEEQLKKLLHFFLIPLLAILLLTFALAMVFGDQEDLKQINYLGVPLLLVGVSIKLIRAKLKKSEK